MKWENLAHKFHDRDKKHTEFLKINLILLECKTGEKLKGHSVSTQFLEFKFSNKLQKEATRKDKWRYKIKPTLEMVK